MPLGIVPKIQTCVKRCKAVKTLFKGLTSEQRTENPCVPGSIPGGTTQINTPIEMIIFQWEYLFTPTPPIPSNML